MKGYAYECDALKDVRDYVFECSPFCRCWEIGCKNRIVHDGVERLSYMDLMVISASNIHGFGLKATCDIPHGTFIGEVLGQVISPANLDARLKLQSAFKEMNIWVLKHHQLEVLSHGIDTTYYCNHTRFINHSCNPNVRGVVIFTNRESTWPVLLFLQPHASKRAVSLQWTMQGWG
ncbi:hypothetical protein BC829DRAFT_267261 [Chytridium lagenaria]|nr:hypothetical protein BC829DRAFT_267261 [Chytridium lagenaria]